MKRVIINGANGYVASNFINELLKLKFEVIALVRDGKKQSSTQRMYEVLADINDGDFRMPSNLKVYGYSLLDKHFGLPDELLTELFSENVDYYHFAASLKYDFKSKEEIFETNLNGVENSINIYSEHANHSSRFFFISTAYSCGKTKDIFEERFYDNEDISKFRNYYEQSKRFAENLIKEKMDKENLNVHILRLSQVVGNNQSGITKTDYGIFDFAKRIHSLAYRNPDATVRVKVDPESTQNLIPIDTIVHYLTRTLELHNLPKIINFTAVNSFKNKHIIESLCQLLPINLVPTENMEQVEMSAIERIISIGMSFTGSYVGTNIRFSTKNQEQLNLPEGNYEVDEKSVHKMLEYFLDTLSGKKGKKQYPKAS